MNFNVNDILEIHSSFDDDDLLRNEINERQLELFKLQKQLYNTRFQSKLIFEDLEQFKEQLRSLIKSLRMKESELRELRLEENRNFKRMLDLESLNLDIYMRVPTPATGKIHTAPGFRRINSAQNLSTKPSPQWNRVLNALDAAQTWKTNWEEKKFQNAKNILNDAQLTKDQIIDLRSTLFRLKQKKSLTHKEKLLAENLQNRLKNLDRYLIEYKRNSSRADE